MDVSYPGDFYPKWRTEDASRNLANSIAGTCLILSFNQTNPSNKALADRISAQIPSFSCSFQCRGYLVFSVQILNTIFKKMYTYMVTKPTFHYLEKVKFFF